jgi:SNF2 family DNA or RNA helicase
VWDRQIDEEGEIINPNNKERLPRNPKLARLIEMLSEKGPNEKTLVFTNWVECIHMIHEELDRVGIKHVVYYGGTNEKDREYAEQMFNNDPSIKVFLGNPAACKEGLDLHGFNEKDATNSFTNTTHVIYYSQNWSMVAREQSEDRAHRRITRHPVRVTDIIVPSTIDEEIQRVVYGKIVNANDIQNVKDIMERVLSTMPEIGAENEI